MRVLENKAVVITGAGRGIGAACARAVARLGAAVIVNDVDPDVAEATAAEIRATGGQAIAEIADIATYAGAERLIAACVRTYGRIDGLVNNAGVIKPDRLEDITEADLRLTMDVNVIGLAFCASHAARQMIRQQSGSIVNVSSGSHTGAPTLSVYAASKGAVASFTYSWAMELAPHGIRVNALLPMAESRMRHITNTYRVSQGLGEHTAPLTPAESNAPVVEFLLSDAAAHVNGQLIKILGRRLGLITHPALLHPVLERDHWDHASVAEAFRTSFADKLQPLGTAVLDVRFMGME